MFLSHFHVARNLVCVKCRCNNMVSREEALPMAYNSYLFETVGMTPLYVMSFYMNNMIKIRLFYRRDRLYLKSCIKIKIYRVFKIFLPRFVSSYYRPFSGISVSFRSTFFSFFALTFEITVTMSLAKMLYLTGIGIFSVDNK